MAALKVMTRNLYLGAELGPVLAVTSFEELVQEVGVVWAKVQSTDFVERAEALADEIAEFDPHVVGLQEVELWRSQESTLISSGCHRSLRSRRGRRSSRAPPTPTCGWCCSAT